MNLDFIGETSQKNNKNNEEVQYNKSQDEFDFGEEENTISKERVNKTSDLPNIEKIPSNPNNLLDLDFDF